MNANISDNTGTGVLVAKAITPMLDALFGLFSLSSFKRHKSSFYISRRKNDRVKWQQIKDRIDQVIASFDLVSPNNKMCMIDYLEYLIMQMADNPNFTQDQLLHLADVVSTLDEDARIEMEQLFKIALALDDGHGLTKIHYESAWHGKGLRAFQFSGDGVYATKDAVIVTDVAFNMSFASRFCQQLNCKHVKEASIITCEHIAHILSDIFDYQFRDLLIKQIANDLPKIAPSVFYRPIKSGEDNMTDPIDEYLVGS